MSSTEKPFRRIIVGVDGSAPSVKALEWAAQQAVLTGSTLEALATWEWPSSYGWAIPIPSDFDPAAETKDVLDRLLKVVHDAHPELEIHTHISEGRPAPALVEASEKADLLVVGSMGHGEFAGMLMGSVSEYCVHHAQCPIVVVH
jgi:nucleotide-binding universal stress UspA family protein